MSHIADADTLPVTELWGATVLGRVIEGDRITLAHIELAPGAEVPGHTHDAEQVGICVAGRMTFTIGDEVRDVVPGSVWAIPSDVYHQVTVGPDGATVIEAFSPVRSDWGDRTVNPPAPPRWPPRG